MTTARVNTLLQGDSIQRLKTIDPGSIDLVFADPPFNIGYDYDVYDDRRSREEYIAWSRDWMTAVSDVLKPSGTFWLAIGDEYAAHLRVLAEDVVGFACRSWVIWYYTFGVNCVRGFSRSHTHLFHFVKDADNFTFNSDNPRIRVPSARQLVYADGRANQNGRLPDNTWIYRPQDAPPSSFGPMHDTWYFARVAGTFKEREGFHGCQMPEQLLGRIVRVSSNPGDIVLDPFSGSGTTLSVAKKLGRRWMGIELSRDYVRKIQERLGAVSAGDDLEGPADPIRSAPTTSQGKKRVRFRNGQPLPQADEKTKKGIVEAFRATCMNASTEQMLCDPDLNAAFIDECKRKSLPGDATVWNRVLLRIRKQGALPRSKQTPKRFTFKDMDGFSFASEIAMHFMSLDYGLKFDDVLCRPAAASKFDRIAADFTPDEHTPFEFRWAALAIRKRAARSRELARTKFRQWLRKQLPKPVPLARCSGASYRHPGVYVLTEMKQPVYVGETFSLEDRVGRMLEAPSWTELKSPAVSFVRYDQHMSHGLQSVLIHRERPFLNSQLLHPELEDAARGSCLEPAGSRVGH